MNINHGDSRSGVSWSSNPFIQTRSMDPCPTSTYQTTSRCKDGQLTIASVDYGRAEHADWRVVGRHRKTIARQSEDT